MSGAVAEDLAAGDAGQSTIDREVLFRLVAGTLQRVDPTLTAPAAHAAAGTILAALHAAGLRLQGLDGRPVPLTDGTGNRRGVSRRRMLKGALLTHSGGTCSLNCVVLDMSDTGLRLRLADDVPVPDRFAVALPFEEPRECELAWRKGITVGARFT